MEFAIFVVFRQLAEWGWPRKKGLRRTRVVSETEFFTAVSNTIQIIMGIGARFPEIGRTLLQELRGGIEAGNTQILGGQNIDQTDSMFTQRAEDKIERFGAQRPWHSVMAMTFSEDGAPVPITPDPGGYVEWDAIIKDENLIHMIGTWPAEGLVYALSNPQAVNAAFSDALELGELFGTRTLTLAQFDEWCEAYVEHYEAFRNRRPQSGSCGPAGSVCGHRCHPTLAHRGRKPTETGNQGN